MIKFWPLAALLVWLSLPAMGREGTEKSTFFDNWQVAVSGGFASKTTHSNLWDNRQTVATLRLGRWFTPVVGWAAEGAALMDNAHTGMSHTMVKAVDVNGLVTLNLSNLLGGYAGRPRLVEVVAVGGLGWSRHLGVSYADKSDMVSKVGVDVAFNLGKQRAWQLFVEPSLRYVLDRDGGVAYDLNQSFVQLQAGVSYKFGNSNGTHHFRTGLLRDQHEVDMLNQKINEQRASSEQQEKRIASQKDDIEQLTQQLEEAKGVQIVTPTVVKQVVNANVLQPTVIFAQGRATIDAAQYASIAMVAKYMKNHPDARLLIKGYASPEGDPTLNQRLSERRAEAVKSALVTRYGTSALRITTEGMGATDELFDELDFNRVVTFTDLSK